MNYDRTNRQQTGADLSDGGLGADLLDFPSQPAAAGKPEPKSEPRPERGAESRAKRQLRATFRSAPDSGGDPGFPGTKSFSIAARRPDSGAPGRTVQSAPAGNDDASTSPARANDLEGWRASIQQAGADARAVGAAVAADQGPEGGRVRGRRAGRPPAAATAAEKKPAKGGPPIPAAIKKLIPKTEPADGSSASPRIAPTEAQCADARRLFREIGQRFNENRKKSKTAAYAGYRHDLMDNMDTLIMGGAIDLKEVTSVITGLEQYTKETEAESTETPATILGRWLRMDAAEVAELEPAVETAEEEIEEESGEEVDELDAATDPGHAGDGHAVS